MTKVPATVCRKGLHAMTPANVRIETVKSADYGVYLVRRCKACQSARAKIYFMTYKRSAKKDQGDANQQDQL